MEKYFKCVLHNRDRAVCILLLIVLFPAETDPVPEERRGKKNLDKPYNSSASKIVLKLLTEVIVVYVGLFALYILEMGF